MIERHPVNNARSTVMPDSFEGIKAEHGHHRLLVGGHVPEGIVFVTSPSPRLAAITVTPQVCCHDGKRAGELGREPMPHEMGLRTSMKQQQRGSISRHPAMNCDFIPHCDIVGREIFEHQHRSPEKVSRARNPMGPIDGEHILCGFLTNRAQWVVQPVHKKAMPVILTEPAWRYAAALPLSSASTSWDCAV